MSRIHVIRHAKPVVQYPPPAAWIRAGQLNEMLDLYDEATVEPFARREPLKGRLIASDLPRARDTASILFDLDSASIQTDPLLREVPLPRFRNADRTLPAGALLAISRVSWYFGWMQSEEPRAETIKRVERAADLIVQASLADDITIVSHGFFLLMLGRQLLQRGYQTEKRGLYAHLERATFRSRF